MRIKISSLNNILLVLYLVSVILPFIIALHSISVGNIPFWYDPARDFLLGQDNIKKLTLIGPTSGIPGIFYGPYWIWLISLGQLVSKDPRVVVFLILAIPYMVIFPFVLFRFKKIFGISTIIILWLYFSFSSGLYYSTNLWNPHLAPILFLTLTYLLVTTDMITNRANAFLNIISAGIIMGLILNLHISFGVAVLFSCVIFFIISAIEICLKKGSQLKGRLLNILTCFILFVFGVFIVFTPFFLFEIKHGFHQIQTAINVFTANGSVVSENGLSDRDILINFFRVISNLLSVPIKFAFILLTASVVYYMCIFLRYKKMMNTFELKLYLFLLISGFCIAFLYLTSKNPVWSYHFIGVEIIFLLFLGLIAKRYVIVKILLLILVLNLTYSHLLDFYKSYNERFFSSPVLITKEQIVNIIKVDGRGDKYSVFAYSPSIYTYEYTYLFNWLANRQFSYDPKQIPANEDIVYLIIPTVSSSISEDFINYRSSNDRYITSKNWIMSDGTTIIKRERIIRK